MVLKSKIRPKSLQQRILVFVLLPVFFLLVGMGILGFLFTRNIILEQWGETAIAKLQRAAHKIDMRLNRPQELLAMIHSDPGVADSHLIHEFIVGQLQKMDGVVHVEVKWPEQEIPPAMPGKMAHRRPMRTKYSRMGKARTSSPRYNALFNTDTVSISVDFIGKDDKKVGGIEVVIGFHDLVDQILKAPSWKSHKAFIIDNDGNILSGTRLASDEHIHQNRGIFGETDLLERMTLKAIQENPYGTVFGPGHPPREISGYYQLRGVPWNIVVIAPGKSVLGPLITFRLYYFLGGILFILAIILFIRGVLYRTSGAIKKVSDAAKEIANGQFRPALPIASEDEVGMLTQNFNVMSRQLEERLKLKEEMTLAMQVQQNLLPPANYYANNLEISGTAVYCDETGGDYFDIIESNDKKNTVFVAVGDVVGHGIGAALLMTTTRALLRSCLLQKRSLSQSMKQVNRLLCQDTVHTGNFVTLFIMEIDTKDRKIKWVRAGHDPAMVYDFQKDQFSELKGAGLVLGLDETFQYTENMYEGNIGTATVLIGTDGVWEVENEKKERLGKAPIKKILKDNHQAAAKDVIKTIISQIENFKGSARQNDDITLVALKFK